jgi:hypothetical protein
LHSESVPVVPLEVAEVVRGREENRVSEGRLTGVTFADGFGCRGSVESVSKLSRAVCDGREELTGEEESVGHGERGKGGGKEKSCKGKT